MEQPQKTLHKICTTKLAALGIENQACLLRCEQLVPIELERAIANEFADYQIQRTANNETCMDRKVFEIRLAEDASRSEHVASVTIHRCTKIAKREDEAKPEIKWPRLTKFVSLVKQELEAQVKRVISAALIFTTALTLYALDQYGFIDLVAWRDFVTDVLWREEP